MNDIIKNKEINEDLVYEHNKGTLKNMFAVRLMYNDIRIWALPGAGLFILGFMAYPVFLEALRMIGLGMWASDISWSVKQASPWAILGWGWFFCTILSTVLWEFMVVTPTNKSRELRAKKAGKEFYKNYFGKVTKVQL